MMSQNDRVTKACLALVEEIKKKNITSQQKLNIAKKKISKEFSLPNSLSNIDILNRLSVLPTISKNQLRLFVTKPTRTGSGVAVIATMTSPKPCPHGKCITCPGGPDSYFGSVPQSYTGHEPATMRAIRNDYDPYLQVFNRLEQYVVMNQSPEKVELIIMGGTFPSYSKIYQTNFVKMAFRAMNDFSKKFYVKGELNRQRFNDFFELPGDINDKERELRIKQKIKSLKPALSSVDLKREQFKNERGKIRCVGLTIETRPDYAMLEHANFMLDLGATRIELGIQSVYDNLLQIMERGHGTKESIHAIRILRDVGFKLNFHYMIGLPGSTPSKDKKGMKELFTNPDYMPDMMKIYPCMVLEGTKLYDLWKTKQFKAMTTKQAAKTIAEFLPNIPEYCRVMRVQRDIATNATVAGVDRTNLRQYVDALGFESRDIRAREPSMRARKGIISTSKPEIVIKTYEASKGQEFFISLEDTKKDILFGFIRMRFPSQQLRKEITNSTALIRELHVYGSSVSIGKTKKSASQHKGFGKQLLLFAETFAKKHHKTKMVIISGVGVRGYYKKYGYKKNGPYVSKQL